MLVIFAIGSCFIPKQDWIAILLICAPHLAGMTGTCLWLRWNCMNFLPGLALNHNPFNLHFPSR
jgi:hypothetical protein